MGSAFFCFPRALERRALWISAVKRKDWEPTADSRVSGRHFSSWKALPFVRVSPRLFPVHRIEIFSSFERSPLERCSRSVAAFSRTCSRQKRIIDQVRLPVDHAHYTRPGLEQPSKTLPRSKLVVYPPFDQGKYTMPTTIFLSSLSLSHPFFCYNYYYYEHLIKY